MEVYCYHDNRVKMMIFVRRVVKYGPRKINMLTFIET